MKEIKDRNQQLAIDTKFPLINAVILKLQGGRIFGDDRENFFFIFHKAAFSYLTVSDSNNYRDALSFLIVSSELPEYFHIYEAPADLINYCNSKSDSVNIKVRKRIQLKYTNPEPPKEKLKIPEGFSIEKIDASNFEDLYVFDLSLPDKFWNSKQDFLNNGFGFVIKTGTGVPASICYAACVANKTAEIDVATMPEFQKRGLAKLVVARFIEYSLSNGITPNWDCFEENFGSLKTALSLGFKRISTYNFLSIFNKTKK